MYAGRPVIGITGGIGSGKSFVARLFGELGCGVIDSDAQARAAYDDPQVIQTLRTWWGDDVVSPGGKVDRAAIARRVFNDPAERVRLEALIHPRVAQARADRMKELAQDSGVVAFVWDTPLLFEAGLRDQCDSVVFVDAPQDLRLQRVRQSRGWDGAELLRRENLQWPLDKKRGMSDDVVKNTADAGDARRQVRQVLSRILAKTSPGLRTTFHQKPGPG